MELKPCRACGKPCRVEVYGPNAAIQEPMGLWICSNTSRVGGDCPDPNAYLSAEAWNTRPTADLGEDGELDAESIARLFHETYERLAPQFSYETRKASAVPWEQVPENNRKLMIAVAAEVRDVLSRSA